MIKIQHDDDNIMFLYLVVMISLALTNRAIFPSIQHKSLARGLHRSKPALFLSLSSLSSAQEVIPSKSRNKTSTKMSSSSSNIAKGNKDEVLAASCIADLDSLTTTKSLEEYSPSYETLLEKLRTLTILKRVSGVLNYDRMVMMPQSDNSSKQRGQQLSIIASIMHEKATESEIHDLIEKAKNDLVEMEHSQQQQQRRQQDTNQINTLDEHCILKLAKKSYEKKVRIPPSLEARRAGLSSKAYSKWVKAREQKDFNIFVEDLEECFETAKEVATALRTDKDTSLYTQMLDEFEMGMDGTRIDEIFGKIERALKPLIAQVKESEYKPNTAPLQGTFNIMKQKEMAKNVVTQIGFDLDKGRIDESVHPFHMSLGTSDVRITSRFRDDEWSLGLAATVHEGGHAMYEQNLGDTDLEIDEYLSMGMHESQALFWQRHVGQSKSFCNWLTPILKDTFGESNFDHSAQDIYDSLNAAGSTPIRVEANELAYPLHIILRYNIERDVVEGRLSVKDVPKRWNDDMKKKLNIEVENDALGCLQDMHWSVLAIGYFPTYLIGSATAAQLAHYCQQDNPQMWKDIERGEFDGIKAWLNEKVHKHGKRYESLDSLLQDQVGETLNPQYFIDYLTKKYKSLYKLE